MLPVVNHVNANVLDITINIRYFPLVGNTFLVVQFVRNSPNQGWLYNQACKRGELLAKAHAATTKKMLNGMPGVTNPMYAIPTQNRPKP